MWFGLLCIKPCMCRPHDHMYTCDTLISILFCCVGVNGQSGSTPSYTVTITTTPSATNYIVGDPVTLICMVDPPIVSTSVTVAYLWQCDDCFADNNTDMVIIRTLTDMDTSMINCSATVDGVLFMTDEPFDLLVTQGMAILTICV